MLNIKPIEHPNFLESCHYEKLGKQRKAQHIAKNCYLCQHRFYAKTVFERFCPACRNRNEILKYESCFADVDEAFLEQISA